jgi:hypothetical protein
MAQQTIDIGSAPNDGTGDPIRDAFDKCNDNFTELYNGLSGLLDFKGSTDTSGNPNYPAAFKGDTYLVSVAGKIGGASGVTVEAGDLYLATADNAGGTQAAVGSSWTVIQGNVISAGGGTIAVEDEGSEEGAAISRLNFTGTGVSVTVVGNEAEIIVPGGISTFALGDATDVDTAGASAGEPLVYDGTGWVAAGGTVPDGGTTGQVLTKQSGVDQDTDWETPAVPYVIQRLWMTPDGLLKTFNVNSTTYINALIPFEHYLDRDVFPATHFRILISGQSNAVGATVTVQLADWGAPTTGLHTGGNDLVITNTLSAFDSGWLAYNDASVGFRHNTLACKGSNATVDLSIFFAEIHYKIA